jgi:uncharacterized protein YjbI with pentapeptide repeats
VYRRGFQSGKGFCDFALDGADLRGAIFADAEMGEARLVKVDLRGADLRVRKLWTANLEEADLRGADLRRVD